MKNFLLKNRETILRFIILVTPSLIMWIILYPAYFQADHQITIAEIANGTPSEWHSLVWGYLAFPFIYLSGDYAIYGIVQILIFAIFINFGIGRLKFLKHTYLLTIFMAIFPTYVLYNQLYSSDMIFAFTLFPLSALYIEYVVSKQKVDSRYFIWLFIFTLIACLMRKNAILIPLAGIILFLVNRFSHKKIFIVLNLVCIASVFIMTLFFTSILHAQKSPNQEFMGIPCLQVAAVYNQGGEIPQDTSFEETRSAEEWAQAYIPYSCDAAKHNAKINLNFLISWIKTGLKNPYIYLSTYVKLNCPFWEFGMDHMIGIQDVNTGFHRDFYEQNMIPEFTTDHTYNIKKDDFVANRYLEQFDHGERLSNAWKTPYNVYKKINQSNNVFAKFILNSILFNRALPFWILLIGFCLMLYYKVAKKYLFITCPVLAILICYLLCAPMPLMRYSIMLYYALPLTVAFCLYIRRSKKALATKTIINGNA